MDAIQHPILKDPTRLAALRETSLLDGPPEKSFDVFTRIAARVFKAPVSLVSLVDSDRQFFKSLNWLPEPFATARETPLSHSFCQHVVMSGQVLAINDSRDNPLVKDNLAISDLGVIAYLGVPLITHDGHRLGSFCVIDGTPREWTADDVVALQDIATAVMSEIEWRRRVNAAQSDIRARDHFMAILSHELRTPLSPALLTAAAMAMDTTLPSEVREDASVIQRNIQTETRLIDDLLDSTRIASGKLKLHVEAVDAHQLITMAASMCADDARAKHLQITFDLHAASSFVVGDPARLQQVFWNLLKNAIKFTPEHGTILVRTADQAEEILLVQITDTGVGIPSNLLDAIFIPFEQGGSSVTRKFGGLGLGLSICKGIVELHHGRLSVHSLGVGHGSTFSTELKATLTPAGSTKKNESLPLRQGQPGRILLVDDHKDTLRSMHRLLAKLGHEVMTANSVESALKTAAEAPFDLLISDIGLPDGTGIELMTRLQAIRPVVGIAVSGYGMEADVQDALAAGFSRHLVKPINFAHLEAAIRDLSVTAG